MRETKDLIPIRVTTVRELTVDLEQLEGYPRFVSMLDTIRAAFILASEADYLSVINFTIQEYIKEQIRDDNFPYKTPGTTGPGRVVDLKVEVISNGFNS